MNSNQRLIEASERLVRLMTKKWFRLDEPPSKDIIVCRFCNVTMSVVDLAEAYNPLGLHAEGCAWAELRHAIEAAKKEKPCRS